ncbi:MAG: hypothetical protein IJT08_01220, partial [Alphaproteobacteria bacterium]|nr:hypothetical protein [Alphaproteobacteria bacterium]
MNGRHSDRRTFTKRAAIFALMEFVLGLVVLARLAYLQIFQAEHYKLLSDKNRIVSKCLLPSRGRILDIKGNLLAKNEFSYSAVLDLFAINPTERAEVTVALLKHCDFDQKVVEKLQNLPRVVNNENRFILLQEDLDWTTLSGYSILTSKVPGLTIEKYQRRRYLVPEILSHVIGYTGAPTKSDIEKFDNSALSVPTARIGKTGIERQYEGQ